MHDTIFLSAVQQLTDGDLGLTSLIHAAGELTQAGQPKLAQQLYKIWISFNREHPQLFVAQFNASVLASELGEPTVAADLLRDAILKNADFLPAYINLGGLGFDILQGIPLRRDAQVLGAAVIVILLALLLDALFGIATHVVDRVIPDGSPQRRPRRLRRAPTGRAAVVEAPTGT